MPSGNSPQSEICVGKLPVTITCFGRQYSRGVLVLGKLGPRRFVATYQFEQEDGSYERIAVKFQETQPGRKGNLFEEESKLINALIAAKVSLANKWESDNKHFCYIAMRNLSLSTGKILDTWKEDTKDAEDWLEIDVCPVVETRSVEEVVDIFSRAISAVRKDFKKQIERLEKEKLARGDRPDIEAKLKCLRDMRNKLFIQHVEIRRAKEHGEDWKTVASICEETKKIFFSDDECTKQTPNGSGSSQ